MDLYHVTTPKKARRYSMTGHIKKPVRGFTTLKGAMAWAIKVKRTVILKFTSNFCYKLPDHHNRYGDAWWADEDISSWNCVFSAEKDG